MESSISIKLEGDPLMRMHSVARYAAELDKGF